MNLSVKYLPIISIWLFVLFTYSAECQIANGFHNDENIGSHPDVIFVEMFEQDSIQAVLTGWNSYGYVNSNILLDSSVPSGSLGQHSLRLRTIETGPSSTEPDENSFIYKKIFPTINDSVFVRYYIKYESTNSYHHSGVYLGGKNPPSNTPGIQAGLVPAGNKAFHVGSELRGATNLGPADTSTAGFYNYWLGMNQSAQGPFWGNEFHNNNTNDEIAMDEWHCIEVMVKLNNPVSASNGELAMWVNGIKVTHLGYLFPTGTWDHQHFTQGPGTPFNGFQWRNNDSLGFNYLWLTNYSTNNSPIGHEGNMYIDHLVVAKNYIGPIFTPADIREDSPQSEISVYPNPARGLVRVRTGSEKLRAIKIYSITGELLRESFIDNFSVSDLPHAIYFLLIQTEKNVYMKKLLR